MPPRLLTLTLLLPLLASCGDSPNKLQTEAVDQYKNISNIIDTVTDETSAKEAVGKIEDVKPKLVSIAERQKKLEKVANVPFAKAFPDILPVLIEIRGKLEALQKKDPADFKIIDDAITANIGKL